jgi:hypothetical protein
LVAEWQGALKPEDVTVRLPYAFVAAEAGIHVLDVSTPSDPVEVEVRDTPGVPSAIESSDTRLFLNDIVDLAVYDLGGCLD